MKVGRAVAFSVVAAGTITMSLSMRPGAISAGLPEPGTATIALDKLVYGGSLSVADFRLQIVPVTIDDWSEVFTNDGYGSFGRSTSLENVTPGSAVLDTVDTDAEQYHWTFGEPADFSHSVSAEVDAPQPSEGHGATYLIREDQQPGYSGYSWYCMTTAEGDFYAPIFPDDDSAAEQVIVEVDAGDELACYIQNVSLRPDLEMDKSVISPVPSEPEVAPVVVAGNNVTYRLVITNRGGTISAPPIASRVRNGSSAMPDDELEPFAIDDDLPTGQSIVGPLPEGCTGVGTSHLSCLLDSALVDAPNSSVTIDLVAHVAADTPHGFFTNIAMVDAAYDPLCPYSEGEHFDNPCEADCYSHGESPPSNNIDCADIEIVRNATVSVRLTDDTGTGTTQPGASYAYTLVVNNSGPSTLLDLELVDDFPDMLHIDSIEPGAGWACNATDPVMCTMPLVFPGDTAAIVVHVTVDASFTGTEIPDLASASAVWDVQDEQLMRASTAADEGSYESVATGPYATNDSATNLILIPVAIESTTTTTTTTSTVAPIITTTTVAPTTSTAAETTVAAVVAVAPVAPAAPPSPEMDVELPSTGTDSESALMIATLGLGIGAVLVIATRRRRLHR